jgi:hypothetical protein
MEFNSQICTTEEQSERLMALGLKKETADMMLVRDFCYLTNESYRETIWTPSIISAHNNFQEFVDSMTTTLKGISKQFVNDGYKPAWSLHRLIEMCNKTQFGMTIGIYNDEVTVDGDLFEVYDNTYDNLISIIEWLIGLGKFNENYLNCAE